MTHLRPFQKQALDALLSTKQDENHVLCVSPTGSGKSRIFEKAALMPLQRAILITPLVALARQQFSRLKDLGLSALLGAGGANDSPSASTQSGVWIISPEGLCFPSRHNLLLNWRPNLLIVDECHCLWEWGDRFRPAFLEIPKLLSLHSIRRSLWLTATLPYEAREDLRKLISQPLVELGGFDLPAQVYVSVVQVSSKDRLNVLIQWITRKPGPGIIFVSTREATQRLSRALGEFLGKDSENQILSYHGGMSPEERRNAEELVRKGIPRLIIATSAFGMGMDYPHLEYVVLWHLPTSILSLVQTIGRIGRNPNRIGHALIFWDYPDFHLVEWTVKDSEKRRKELEKLHLFLTSKKCRRLWLKEYFDRITHDSPCNKCDICSQNRLNYS